MLYTSQNINSFWKSKELIKHYFKNHPRYIMIISTIQILKAKSFKSQKPIILNVPSFDKWYSSENLGSLRKYNYACVRSYYFKYYTIPEIKFKYPTAKLYLATKKTLEKLRSCDQNKKDKLDIYRKNQTSMDKINTPEIKSYKYMQNLLGSADKSQFNNPTSLDKLTPEQMGIK